MDRKAESSLEAGEKTRSGKMAIASAIVVAFLAFSTGCKKESDLITNDDPATESNMNGMRDSYSVNYNVSDIEGYHATHIDPTLVNAWGMAFNYDGTMWIASQGSGYARSYDSEGNATHRLISIPAADRSATGSPTGMVQNISHGGFIIPVTGERSTLIFATEDGTIAAYASGRAAYTVVDRSGAHAVYKGLAIGMMDGSYRLYATDFYNKRIDVFDEGFRLLTSNQFTDPRMPSGYAPFGIRAFNDKLVVTYALQSSSHDDDQPGLGNGFVDIYKTNGQFMRRFVSGGNLNSPWGIEVVTPTRTRQESDDLILDNSSRRLLIGNFGDGHINIYDGFGNYKGQLMNNGEAITIEGLWAISFKSRLADPDAASLRRLYFTAGPKQETHGVTGYITW